MNAHEMLRGSQALFVGVAACALSGCGGQGHAAESSPLIAATTMSLTCSQVSPGRPANRQTVTATVDAGGAVVDVSVRRGPSAQLEHVAAAPMALPGYQNGYYEQTYNLLAWNLGSEAEDDYFLLLPEAGVTPGTFTAQLHLYFNHGDSGWWQKVLACTAQ